MLTCKEVTEIITDYLEGKMSFVDKIRFHMHLGMCRHCREYLKQMKETQKLVGNIPKEEMPEDLHNELLKRFDNWKR